MQYQLIWRNKWLTATAQTIDDMITCLQQATDQLRTMQARGVTLRHDCSVQDDYATLITDDPVVAEEFGFEAIQADEDPEPADAALITQ